ncbi:MBL fold metallo-hydrolase [Kineococcus sp. SYSU DK003]|uniref:MBL fold metallo-hydrolase n=1 Tax=Kineococcus sp. SYSU DK003 TaxID=3383124 RepID=UPI003D7C7DB1
MSAPDVWTGGPVTDRATCVLQANPGPMTLEGTNTWLLAAPGAPEVVVVDPGEDDPAHRAATTAALAGRRVALVVATHHHRDHVGGLDDFLAQHPAPVVREPGAHDVAGLSFDVLATPGHTADSVCIQLATGELLTGDTLLGRGSTVVAADGDLGDHLDSLDLLLSLDADVALPGHGPARTDVRTALRTQLDHRLQRLEQVRAALAAGADTVADVVRAVHGDLEPTLERAATQSIRAQLAYLGHPLR